LNPCGSTRSIEELSKVLEGFFIILVFGLFRKVSIGIKKPEIQQLMNENVLEGFGS